jgi:hypothetical protein
MEKKFALCTTKKINILTLVLSENKFLYETKNHNPPFQVKWSIPYDVPNWFLVLKNFYRSPFSKWPHNTAHIQYCPISTKFHMRDIIIYPHIKFWWYWTMLNFCGIVVAILKMATDRNFSMSGINSGHHNLPAYEISLKSDNIEYVRYCGAILKMEIGRNFSIQSHLNRV